MVIAMFKAEQRADVDVVEYQRAAQRMMELVTKMPGFISFKGCTTDDGETFAMATFESEQALDAWHNHPEHRATQKRGYDARGSAMCAHCARDAIASGDYIERV